MQNIAIRPVTPGDLMQWRRLWNAYNAFYGREGATALDEYVVQTTWERFFDVTEPVHGLVAELDGRIVGIAHYLFHRSTISISNTCYLQDLFTDAAARGQGVARRLIETVYAKATMAEATRVYWQTHESNATARALYDRVADNSGFIVYHKRF